MTDTGLKLYKGDCLELMKDIPDKSVDLTVTSPPYDKMERISAYDNKAFEFI